MPFCLKQKSQKVESHEKRNIYYQQAKLKGTELHIKGKLFVIGKKNKKKHR